MPGSARGSNGESECLIHSRSRYRYGVPGTPLLAVREPGETRARGPGASSGGRGSCRARMILGSAGARSRVGKRARQAFSLAEGQPSIVGAATHGLEREVIVVLPGTLANQGVVLALAHGQDAVSVGVLALDRPALA